MQTGKIYKGTTLISGGGSNGKSAYELWLDAGHTGTEADFLASLQGNSGYSGAAGELEVVNNFTDGGTTAALSAEMGKVLYNREVFLTKAEYDALPTIDSDVIYNIYEEE